MRSHLWISTLVAAFMLPCSPVLAQTDQALAETLFQEGRRLMDAGRFADACPKLKESQRLDPATGTLLNLGRCYKESGKPASAWVVFNEAIASARVENRADRVALAQDEVKKLEQNMPRLSVVVPPEADVQGLQITLDDSSISQAARGVASPVDPGDHRVTASAPGRKPWSTTVSVKPGAQTHTVVVPVLEVGAGTAPATTAQTPATGATAPLVQQSGGGYVPPPEPAPTTEPIHRFVLGARLLAGIPMGKLDEEDSFSGQTKAQGALWIDAGYRVIPPLTVGAYFAAGAAGVGSSFKDFVADSSGGQLSCGPDADCSVVDLQFGVQAQYTIDLDKWQPWFGAGLGYEIFEQTVDFKDVDMTLSARVAGVQWLTLQGGVDYSFGRVGVGPFLGLQFARFTTGSIHCKGDYCPYTEEDVDIENPTFHEWLLIGARGTFSL